MESNDATLVERLKAGEESALGVLISTYGARVFGLAKRLTGKHHDAEEVAQDVFLTVFNKIETFRGESKLSSWIYRITANAALMKLRKNRRIKEIPLETELSPKLNEEGMLAEPVSDWTAFPDEVLQRKELARRIEVAVQDLPADYRAVFVLRDIEGLSGDETSEVLDISIASMKSRLHRARLYLRKLLSNYVMEHKGVEALDKSEGM